MKCLAGHWRKKSNTANQIRMFLLSRRWSWQLARPRLEDAGFLCDIFAELGDAIKGTRYNPTNIWYSYSLPN